MITIAVGAFETVSKCLEKGQEELGMRRIKTFYATEFQNKINENI